MPNLLGMDEIGKIQTELLPECKKRDIIPSLDNIMALYIQTVRENLFALNCLPSTNQLFPLN